jgi:hypothetical protein
VCYGVCICAVHDVRFGIVLAMDSSEPDRSEVFLETKAFDRTLEAYPALETALCKP